MVLLRPRSPLLDALAVIAPGRPLRDGLDRVLQANKGALVIVGDGPDVLDICSGGFLFDAEFSPQRMAELAKMDGAIIVASDASRIARANVHLVPNPNVSTSETGTRHRTAERVARSIDIPVIAVSEDMGVITLYRRDVKHRLDSVPRLLNRSNQALQTLERYRIRLDAVTSGLSALEVEDLVTVQDVTTVLQRTEMVRRIADEVVGYIVELGSDGRLLRLQLEELMAGVDDERRDVIRDYVIDDDSEAADRALAALGAMTTEHLLDLGAVARAIAMPVSSLDDGVVPRGYRLLAKIPRVSERVVAAIVARYGSLQKVMGATTEDLLAVDGVGRVHAHTVKDGLARLAESSLLDRYS